MVIPSGTVSGRVWTDMDAGSAGGVCRYDKAADESVSAGGGGGGTGVDGNGGVDGGGGDAGGGGAVSGAVNGRAASSSGRGGVDGGVFTRATGDVSGIGHTGTGRVGLTWNGGGGWLDMPVEREGCVEYDEAAGSCFRVFPGAGAAFSPITVFQPTAAAPAHSKSPRCHSFSPLRSSRRSPKLQITPQLGGPVMTSANFIGNKPLQQ